MLDELNIVFLSLSQLVMIVIINQLATKLREQTSRQQDVTLFDETNTESESVFNEEEGPLSPTA